jgi:hypothetical protein
LETSCRHTSIYRPNFPGLRYRPPSPPSSSLPQPDSLTRMLIQWKKSVGDRWSSVREEWESKVKSVKTMLVDSPATPMFLSR